MRRGGTTRILCALVPIARLTASSIGPMSEPPCPSPVDASATTTRSSVPDAGDVTPTAAEKRTPASWSTASSISRGTIVAPARLISARARPLTNRWPSRVERADVARVQPAVPDDLPGRPLVVKITGEHRVAAHRDFAIHAGRLVAAGGVDDANVQAGIRAAARHLAGSVEPERFAPRETGHAERRLRESVRGTHDAAEAESPLEGLDRRPSDGFSAVGGDGQRAKIDRPGIDQSGGQAIAEVRAGCDRRPDTGRRGQPFAQNRDGRLQEVGRAAEIQRGEHESHQAEIVVQRHPARHHVARPDAQPLARSVERRAQLAMPNDDGAWLPRRAGGELQKCGLVGRGQARRLRAGRQKTKVVGRHDWRCGGLEDLQAAMPMGRPIRRDGKVGAHEAKARLNGLGRQRRVDGNRRGTQRLRRIDQADEIEAGRQDDRTAAAGGRPIAASETPAPARRDAIRRR